MPPFRMKTIKGETVSVDLPADATASELKASVVAARQDWAPASRLRIVSNGSVLADADSLTGAASFLSGGMDRFLVVVVKPIASRSPAKPDTSPGHPVAAVQPPSPPPPLPQPPPPPDTPADDALSQLLLMGFEQSAAESALAASYGHVARAVDALTGAGGSRSNGGAPRELAQLGRVARAADLARGLAADEAQMAMLRRMPEVQRLLQLPRLQGIESRPEELQRLLQGILLRPELQQAMKAGAVTDEMIEGALSGEAPPPSSRAERLLALAQRHAAATQASPGRAASAQAPTSALDGQLQGEEDEAAVARLCELGGFSRRAVLEAFLACDRNEALAANLLFDKM